MVTTSAPAADCAADLRSLITRVRQYTHRGDWLAFGTDPLAELTDLSERVAAGCDAAGCGYLFRAVHPDGYGPCRLPAVELPDDPKEQGGGGVVFLTNPARVEAWLAAADRALSALPAVERVPGGVRQPDHPTPVVLNGPDAPPVVLGKEKRRLTPAQYDIINALLGVGEAGLTESALTKKTGHGDSRKILNRLRKDSDWAAVIQFPGRGRWGVGYRIIRPDPR